MKRMDLLKRISKIYLYLVGLFFILMSADCFGSVGCPECDSFGENVLCFGISIIPGVVIIALNYFLRKKERLLGLMFIVFASAAFFVLKFYREFLEKIPMFIIIVIIPIAIGVLFLYPSKKDVE